MPRKAYNVSRQRTRGNAITINGLLTWRARRLRSLRLQEGDTGALAADIAALDRVLVNVLGYAGDIEADTRDFRREALFRRNELRKMVADVLRLRWCRYLRQGHKVDLPMKRTIQHEDTQTVYGRVQGQGCA